jgi:hypothetical protein
MLLSVAAIAFAFGVIPGSIRTSEPSTDFEGACFNPGASDSTSTRTF